LVQNNGVPAMVACLECGQRNPGQNAFCVACGAELKAPQATVTQGEKDKRKRARRHQNRVLLIIGGLLIAGCIFTAVLDSLSGEKEHRTAALPAAATTAGEEVSISLPTRTLRPTATPQPSRKARPAPTQASTPTPGPTQTPSASLTPSQTPTPTETHTPQPTKTPTLAPTPITLTGQGQAATEAFVLPAAISIAQFTHTGQRNFIVQVYQDGGSDLLINTIGPYRGSRPLSGSAPITLDIDADGAWTVEVRPLGFTETANFAGQGDAVSALFDPPPTGPWDIQHNGQRNFIVQLHCAGGSDLVQNEIGQVNGSRVVRFAEGPCLWEVQADGAWSLKQR